MAFTVFKLSLKWTLRHPYTPNSIFPRFSMGSQSIDIGACMSSAGKLKEKFTCCGQHRSCGEHCPLSYQLAQGPPRITITVPERLGQEIGSLLVPAIVANMMR